MGTDRKLRLEVITPGGVVVRDDVDYVEAPGALGYFGILPGHAPFLSQIRSGRLQYRQEGHDHFLAVHWGFLEVHDDEVIVLAETAERAEDLELQRAESALARARNRQKEFGTPYDPLRLTRAAARAETRLEVLQAAAKAGPER